MFCWVSFCSSFQFFVASGEYQLKLPIICLSEISKFNFFKPVSVQSCLSRDAIKHNSYQRRIIFAMSFENFWKYIFGVFVNNLPCKYSKKWVWQSLSNIYFLSRYLQVRQVLTLVENSSLLLKLQIFNKSRLATLYKHSTQRNTVQ
jgi:hypothetical protein